MPIANRQPRGSSGTYGNDAVTSAVSIPPNHKEVEGECRERYQDHDDAPFGQYGTAMDARRVRAQRERLEDPIH